MATLAAMTIAVLHGATAADAAVQAASINVVSDGTGHGNPVTQCPLTHAQAGFIDQNATDGVVCTNDSVTWRWNFNFDAAGVEGVTFSQTLPAGWSWQQAPSRLACEGDGSTSYTGVASFSGQTFSCVISVPAGLGSGTVGLPVSAVAGPNIANGSMYAAELVVTDPNGPLFNRTATPVIVRSEPRFELHKLPTDDQGFDAIKDFDGPSLEPAYWADFWVFIDVANSSNTKGIEPLQSTFTFTDNPAGIDDEALIAGHSPSSGSITVTQPAPGAEATITVAGANTSGTTGTVNELLSASAVWMAKIRVYLPLRDVPDDPTGLDIVNQYRSFDPAGINGTSNLGDGVEQGTEADATCADFSVNNNCAEIHLEGPTGSGTPGTPIEVAKDLASRSPGHPCNDLPDIDPGDGTGCPRLPGDTGAENGYMSPGGPIWARMYLNPATETGGLPRILSDLVVCDSWDPALQTIDPNVAVKVGWRSALDPSAYQVQYTNRVLDDDADRRAAGCGIPDDNDTQGPWYDTIEAAGGATAVSGIRVNYTGNNGDWATGEYFAFSVPMIAGTTITGPSSVVSVPDFFGGRWDQRESPTNPTGYGFLDRDGYRVVPELLSIDKNTEPANIFNVTSGATVSYSLTPSIRRPGVTNPPSVEGVTVVDTLDTCMRQPILDGRSDEWTMSVTPGDSGGDQIFCTPDDVSPPILTFAHTSAITPNRPVQPIVYSVVISPLVPNATRLTNTVVVNEPNTLQRAETRTDAWTVTVTSPGAVKVLKQADFPVAEIEPDQLSWTVEWSNTLGRSAGQTQFIDVLPYNGDDRNTSFNGSFNLSEVAVIGGSTSVTVEYSDADPATIDTDPLTNDTTWCARSDLGTPSCPADLAAVTALRITESNLAGFESGGLTITASPVGNVEDDVYVNNIGGGRAASLIEIIPATPPVPIRVVASTIGDLVWMDVDADGLFDDGEEGISRVTVRLYDESGEQIDSTVTNDAGLYLFGNRHSGEYRVDLDPATLPDGAEPTYDLDGGTTEPDNDSGPFAVEFDTDRLDVDFGVNVPPPPTTTTTTPDTTVQETTTTSTPDTTVQETTTTSASGNLPFTGADIGKLLLVGLLTTAGGAVLVALGRRRGPSVR